MLLPCFWEKQQDTISRTSFDTVTSAQPKLTILVEGVPHEYLIVALNQTPATLVRASGHTLSLTRGNTPAAVGKRLWLARDPSLGADSYVQLSLLGKSLSYSLDLSGVGCSATLRSIGCPCRAMIKTATPRLEHSATTVRKRASITRPLWAFSHVPAAHLVASHADICGSALFPVRTDCDANFVGGVWCWEHDTVEANRLAMVAPHQCVAPPGRYIANATGLARRVTAM